MKHAACSPQRLTVLGSTGSIGTNTLDVVRRHPGRYKIFALSAATQVQALLAQCVEFRPHYAVMSSAPHAAGSSPTSSTLSSTGSPAPRATRLASILSPIAAMASGGGPIHT